MACSPCEDAPPDCCCRLRCGHRVCLIAGGHTAACLLASSFSTATAQPGSRSSALPDCYVLMKAHVASVCFEYFRCFRGILQVFQMDVAKVDWDITYVTMVVYVCYKGLLPMFHLCFPNACCKCVYLDVAYVLSRCCVWLQWFSSVFRCFFECFS
jgi:hypothetical protein